MGKWFMIWITAAMPLVALSQNNMPVNFNQDSVTRELSREIQQLKDIINDLKTKEQQNERIRYQRNYQVAVNGLEIIKELNQGIADIVNARSQNLLYKKLIDINNPSSDALGFQLIDVIDKTLEENISLLPLLDGEKKRLRGQVSGLVDGLKRTFPPLQLITGAFSLISSFTTFKARTEQLSRKTDTMIVEASNPITKDILEKINNKLAPYIDFYNELNRTNSIFENALYQHVIMYKDYIDEVNSVKAMLESTINFNESIADQVSTKFNLFNSSQQDFNYKQVNESDSVKQLVGNCITVYDLVEKFKKFSNDFLVIQTDFFKDNINVLQLKAKKLPFKDAEKIDQLITDLNELKNGRPQDNIAGFDASYKLRLKSISGKLAVLNKLRLN